MSPAWLPRAVLVADHRAAGFLAGTALFGALGHVLVVGNLLASLGAACAGLGTGAADGLAERTIARDDAGRRRADLGAVLASAHRLLVILVAFGHLPQTMGGARIALALAIVARLGAIVVLAMTGMSVGGARGRAAGAAGAWRGPTRWDGLALNLLRFSLQTALQRLAETPGTLLRGDV